MTQDLTKLFSPASIVVIGASRDPSKVGAIVLKNIISSNFPGSVYPVNPNIDNINGQKCYPNVDSLPEIPDLAIIAVPSTLVPVVLEEIGKKNIKNVIIFSAGFKEIGPDGEKLENQLASISQKFQINLLGPNCLGFINNTLPLNATFGRPSRQPGNLKIISQSGALAASLFDWCEATNLGLNTLVTIGNKTVLSENDILRFWQNKKNNSPIGLYLESIKDGQEFLSLTSEISKTNPIFILKPGKSAAAVTAMKSHTGAIASDDSVLEIALKKAGVIRCRQLSDFFDLARAFSWENAPQGPRVAIISNAGGPAVLTTDAIEETGLQLAKFSDTTKQKLGECLPRISNFLNPVDVLGDALASRFSQALDIVLQEGSVDAVLVILTPQLMTQIEETAKVVGDLSKIYPKPVLCSFIGGNEVARGEKILNNYKIPSFSFPEKAIHALSAMWHWQCYRQSQVSVIPRPTEVQKNLDTIEKILTVAKKDNRKTLNSLEANEIINNIGIPTPPTKVVTTVIEAQNFASDFGWPIVLKLSSSLLLHKSDIGGVITQIFDKESLKIAWEKLDQAKRELDQKVAASVEIQVQKEIVGGVEVIVGVKYDPTFGPVLLFGAGGRLAEILVDKNLSMLPITQLEVQALVSQSKISKILNGYRGEPAYNLDKLYDSIIKLGNLALNQKDLSEIEINPIKVTLNGVWALDTKVILKDGITKTINSPQFKSATTIFHKILAGNFHHFVFKPDTPFTYLPGQYISVKVADQRINAYSIAGKVDGNLFELLVDISPGGPGSKFFENLKVGERIAYLGPFGIFTLKPDDGAEHLLFLGTGSGCTPLKCMVEAALLENKLNKPITFYFGLRYQNDIFWQQYFESLSKKYPNFKYKLCLSKPNINCPYETGHVTDLFKRDFKDTSRCSAYLCGNKTMIEEARQILTNSGCPSSRIYTEQFF